MSDRSGTTETKEIGKVAVLGAGTMGHGIAQVCAGVGCEVALYDIDDTAVQKGLSRIRGNLDKGVELGKVTPEHRDAVLGHVATTTSVADARRSRPR